MSETFTNEESVSLNKMSLTAQLKAKYLDIAKTQSLQAAINQLHHDLWDMEKECFDSPEGYEPVLWKNLNEMRIFSRELWDTNLNS